MSLSVQTSFASMVTQNSLSTANDKLTTAMERLSTGYAVNSSADDAAGLSIATRMQSQSDGITVAQDNVEDASSMLSTADGALESMVDIVGRMKDLATQAANDTYSTDDRTAMQSEYDELSEQLTSVMSTTSYGGTDLLSSTGLLGSGSVNFQVGASTSETLTVNISAALGDITSGITSASGASLASSSGASSAIDALEDLTSAISTVRSDVGAKINRLDYISDNLTNMQENTDTAIGNIMDADYASETSEMSKQQLLEQAGISVLSAVSDAQSLITNLLQ
ncbi:flagellin [Aeromonas sp. RU39B]|uniref:flagellin N-terminal helical domain-containing protein n=1 Tax=Aeromonas sp. RU39B TaxID=1907416 RepID=UPI0009569EF4|nr:flagellin [Aeromonas sp. RU39B]SIR17145.1 flagellin [Aeromonas sp. RU39B]